jgi:hypothetical protein
LGAVVASATKEEEVNAVDVPPPRLTPVEEDDDLEATIETSELHELV